MAAEEAGMRHRTVEQDLEAWGEELHRELTGRFGLETEAWAIERVREIGARLQEEVPRVLRLQVEILWLQQMTAFAAPGQYVYISRELLQRLPSDDSAAFPIAHEIAHHHLGHLGVYPARLPSLRRLPGGVGPAILLQMAERLLLGPEKELEADSYALDLCLKVGCDGEKCLEVFDVTQAYLLDHGDVHMVYGPDARWEKSEPGVRQWLQQARLWQWEHTRRYPSLYDRRQQLMERLRQSRTHHVD